MQTKEHFSILLIDDDPTVIRILSRILGDYAPLRFATTGQVALRLAREAVPDLVMLDVEMPGISGFEICKSFKADSLLANVPIIFVTSHESPELETVGLKLGAVDFISKPPHAPLVLARVRTYQQMKLLSDTVRSAVTMDFTTGTQTRRRLEKTLTQEWIRARRSAQPLSLLIVDIDGFSHYNRSNGEAMGDACLHAVADALRSVANRPTDLLARFGGGKFAVLLPETELEGAMTVADRAIRAVDALRDHRVTVSVGSGCLNAAAEVHTLPAEHAEPAELVAITEEALRAAKAAGGHRAAALMMGDAIAPPAPGREPASLRI
jgi:diguanylate cyclase (GGDEF)-like protein